MEDITIQDLVVEQKNIIPLGTNINNSNSQTQNQQQSLAVDLFLEFNINNLFD